jgi:DNA-directed RNA polymerase specialized sigma24 family protein
VAAEAFASAVARWPMDGVPPDPDAWLTTTARREAIDRLRCENKGDDKEKEARMLYDDPPEPPGAIDRTRARPCLIECRPRRISGHASQASSPSSFASSTRATRRRAPTRIPYVTG